MKPALRIDACLSDDCLEQVETLAEAIWREHYTPIIGAAQVEYMLEKFQSVPAMHRQITTGYHYYTLIAEDRLIGYFSCIPEGSSLFLSKYYIDKAFRGKGYGRMALDFIEELVRSQGYTGIRLTVNKYNQKTIDQYLHMGFEIIDDVIMDIGKGYVMDDHVLFKPIRS